MMLCLFLSGTLASQCVVDTSIMLREVDTLNLTFEIEGATNNDLSSIGQGVCQVCVNFNHEFLGDLQVYLESPSGQIVQLIGPTGNFGLTQFSEWDVCFVPSTAIATPDPGFSDRWSSNQLWGAFAGIYSGVYYPFFGRLEDINTGPVNGTWTLRFVDRTIFYVSEVLGFEIQFCDGSGILCEPCSPIDYSFAIPADTFCIGDSTLLMELSPDNNSEFDSTGYSPIFYAIDSHQVIVDRGNTLDLRNAPAGRYRICGLSYYEEHEELLPNISENWLEFLDSTRHGEIAICFGQSECHDIDIFSPSDTLLIDTTICAGEVVTVFGQSFDSTGSYMIHSQNGVGCDSVVQLELNTVQLNASIEGDTLNCLLDEVELRAVGFSGPLGSRMYFRTIEGNITDSILPNVIRVSDPGLYTFYMEYAGCRDSVTYEVIEDDDVPSAEIMGDTIDCKKDSIVLYSESNGRNPQFNWFFSGQNISDEDSTIVGQAGRYHVVVTDENGCSNSSTFEVLIDTIAIRPSFYYDSLNCSKSEAIIQLLNFENYNHFFWEGPGMFQSSLDSFATVTEGRYKFQGESQNGCLLIDSVEIVRDTSTPNFEIKGDTLNCLSPFGEIAVKVDDFSELIWYNKNQEVLGRDTILRVDSAGDYRLHIIGENGCLSDTMVKIIDEKDLFEIEILHDSLKCQIQNPQVWFEISGPLDSHTWINPQDVRSSSDTLNITMEGWYYLIYQSNFGCLYTDSIFIEDFRNQYNIQLLADTITCSNRMTQVTATSQVPGLYYEWSQNGQFLSSDSTFTTTMGGWYVLKVSDDFDCTLFESIEVIVDTLATDLSFLGEKRLTCANVSTDIVLQPGPFSDIQWSGPRGFRSTSSMVQLEDAGVYFVSGIANNGCPFFDSVRIRIDTMRPSVTVESDTLNCFVDAVDLNIDGHEIQYVYQWITPSNDTIDNRIIQARQGGVFEVIVRDTSNKCEQNLRHNVIMDTAKIDLAFTDQRLPCDGDSLRLQVTAQEVTLVQWILPDGGTQPGFELIVSEPGEYMVIAQGRNGCLTMDTFIVASGTLPVPSIFTDTLTCEKNEVEIYAQGIDEVDRFYWLGPNNFQSFEQRDSVEEPGFYFLVLDNGADCIDTFEIEVLQDTAAPMIDIVQEGQLGCESSEVKLKVVTNDVLQLPVEWLVMDADSLRLIGNSDSITITSEDTYFVRTVKSGNGCHSFDSIKVEDVPSDIELAQWTSVSPTCAGEKNGRLSLDSIFGGVGPYMVIFNGEGPVSNFEFTNLEAGSYEITLLDSLGCSADTIVELEDGPDYQLLLPSDTIIVAGDTFRLRTLLSPNPADQATLTWTPDEFLSDPNLENPLSFPIVDVRYTLTITTQEGCVVSDDILIEVEDNAIVYVPNVFSPNGDGINDRFGVFTKFDNIEFVELMIYDRWGEKVYHEEGNLENGFLGWDGVTNGQNAPNGVYAYLLKIRTKGGSDHLLAGDLTIIR